METIAVDPERPRHDLVAGAATVLERGGLVAFPTETFYALGADPYDEGALEALHRAKERPPGAPILLLLDDAARAAEVAGDLPPPFGRLAEVFWPGPLTLVLCARRGLSERLTAGTGTIGVRVPGSALARALAAALGRPVTGTSANLSGAPPARTADEVRRSLEGRVDLLLDGGHTPGEAPSTLVDLSRGDPKLLREGAVPWERVLAAFSGR